MHVTLTDLQNGEPAYLARSLSVPAGGLEVALCELTYYHQWRNIIAAPKNNQASTYTSGNPRLDYLDLCGNTTTVPDGYYNVCELSEDVFPPLGAELNLLAPTGRFQLSMKKRLVLNSGLAKLLGFSRDRFEPGKTSSAGEPHRLAVCREICVHLAEVSSSDNLHNGHPSTLLRSFPVEKERCGSGRTETFSVLQYERLSFETRLSFVYLSWICISEMVDAGGPGSVRKCPGVALADLGDVEWFDRSGEEDQLYAFQLSDGVYKRKNVTPSLSLKFEELSDVDISHAVPRLLHSLAFTGSKWVAFADPL